MRSEFKPWQHHPETWRWPAEPVFASGCRRRREGSGCSYVIDQHPLPASAEVCPLSGEGVSRRVLALDQAGRKPESMQSQDSATAPLLLTAPHVLGIPVC